MKTWTDESEEILLGLIEKLIAPNRVISSKINLNEVVAQQGLEHNTLAEPI
jgi:hypothetical protein